MITLSVVVIILSGFFHMGEYLGKSSRRVWWLKLVVLELLGSFLAAHAVETPTSVMLIPVLPPLVIGLFLKEISGWFRDGFAPRKPGGGIVVVGLVLWSLFSCIPTSLSPLIGIVVIILYTVPIGMVIGGIFLVITEEPPKPPPHDHHHYCHID